MICEWIYFGRCTREIKYKRVMIWIVERIEYCRKGIDDCIKGTLVYLTSSRNVIYVLYINTIHRTILFKNFISLINSVFIKFWFRNYILESFATTIHIVSILQFLQFISIFVNLKNSQTRTTSIKLSFFNHTWYR